MELFSCLATLGNVEIEEQFVENPLANRPEIDEALRQPTPNDPPWGVLEAIAVWVASVLAILIIPTLLLLPYLASHNPPLTESSEIVEFAKSDATAIFLQILAIIPAHILTLVIAWLVVTRVRRYGFRQTLGWSTGGFAWWHYVVILASFMVVAMVVGNFFPEQENDLLRILKSSRSAVYIVAFVATVSAPLVEEVVYRGVLYSAFQRSLGIPSAFVLSTFLFAIVHVPQYYPSFSTIFLLTLLSVTLTSIRVKSGNLLPCIVLHTLFNGLQSVFLLLEPLIKTADVSEPAASILHLLK